MEPKRLTARSPVARPLAPKRLEPKRAAARDIDRLCATIGGMAKATAVRAFLDDLCTPSELSAMAERWRVAQLLEEGIPYREIYEKTGVSTATVTRVARALASGAGGYRAALARARRLRRPRKSTRRVEGPRS
jgi:TrpR-related protein YerC/YecD